MDFAEFGLGVSSEDGDGDRAGAEQEQQQHPQYPQHPQQQHPHYPQQHPQYAQHPQHSQQQPFPSFPALGASLPPLAPVAQFGWEYGRQYVGEHEHYVHSWLSTLKYYFNVNSAYVLSKLRVLLLPVRHSNWPRRMHDGLYLPPCEDVNAPDLYIPTMAFVSYVLLVGFILGHAFRFTPEVLGGTASRALAALLVEMLAIKAGLFFLNSFTVPFLDLIAYCGYKFVGVTLIVLLGFLLGRVVFYAALAVLSVFMAYFMKNTLRILFPDASDDLHARASELQRKYFLFAASALQLVVMYYLAAVVTLE